MLELVSLKPLVWLVVLLALIVALRYSLVDRPRSLRWASWLFRCLSIVALVFALCRPFSGSESDQLHVNFLVDVSQSMDLSQVEKSLDQIDTLQGTLNNNDSWSLFTVGDSLRSFQTTDEVREVLKQWQSGIADDRYRSQSRLANALLESRLTFPSDKSRRTILLTDGQDTDAKLDEALNQLADESIDVRWQIVSGISEAEAAVVSLESSSREAFFGEVQRLTANVVANQAMSAKVRLVHRGIAVLEKTTQLKPDQSNVVQFDVDMKTPGASRWTVEIIPSEDHFPINNQISTTINVQGKPRVLLVHEKPEEMRAFSRALKEQDIEIETRGEFGLPETLAEMAAFDAIVIADLPATSLTPRQMQLLKRYVIDMGGGLMMMGSENSFGLGGYYKTPVEDVLPLVSRYEKEKEKPSLAMVLVIDKSGSMQGQPIELARQAAKAAVELLGPRDTIGVIGFDDEAHVNCEMTSAGDTATVQSAIDSLQAGGGTFMYPAMVQGKDMLESTPAKIRHMICLSDGQTNPANHEGLTEEMASLGITVSTVALGEADRQLMASIADLGKGRYYETNDPANVPQIFTKETMQATKSAIKEDLYGCVALSDHPILSGYDEAELPFTLGYVMTEVKPTSQLLLAAETGDPLLAVGRFGLGSGMAFTSDMTEKWGGEWLAWDGCGKFWAQAIRGIVRRNSSDGMQISTRRTEFGWTVDVLRTSENLLPINGLHWDSMVLNEDGKDSPIVVRETGLGRYQAEIPSELGNQLAFRVRDVDSDKSAFFYFEDEYPAEYRLSSQVPEELKACSMEGDSLRDTVTPQWQRKSIVHWAYFAALFCLIASILLRRV